MSVTAVLGAELPPVAMEPVLGPILPLVAEFDPAADAEDGLDVEPPTLPMNQAGTQPRSPVSCLMLHVSTFGQFIFPNAREQGDDVEQQPEVYGIRTDRTGERKGGGVGRKIVGSTYVYDQ